jgi:preprotein translocase subunit SecE
LANLNLYNMAKVVQFVKESYEEMTQKVTWPTWGELQNSAVLVLVASLIIGIIIFAMDKGANFLLDAFYKSF